MQKSNSAHNFAVVLSIVAIVLASFAGTAAFAQPANPEGENGNVKTIDAIGTYTVHADADRADIYLGVQSQRTNAIDAQRELAARINAIKTRLLVEGIASTDITTFSYITYPQHDATATDNQDSYIAIEILKVAVNDVGKVGSTIDAASEAGANTVDHIEYRLSDAKIEELKSQALKEAIKDARSQADAIADELGVKITEIENVKAIGYRLSYQQFHDKAVGLEGITNVAQYPNTQMNTSAVQVIATISITFAFE